MHDWDARLDQQKVVSLWLLRPAFTSCMLCEFSAKDEKGVIPKEMSPGGVRKYMVD